MSEPGGRAPRRQAAGDDVARRRGRGAEARSARARWGTPGRSTPWRRACSSSGWVERRGCCGSSARSPRPTRAPRGWGSRPTTLDAEGEVTAERPVTATESDIRDAMASLLGDSLQVPPAYSAVKVGGRKLYEAARARRGPRGAGPPDPRRRVRADRAARPRRRLPGHVLRRDLRAGAPGRCRLRARVRRAPHASASHGDRRARRRPTAVEPSMVGDAAAAGAGGGAPPAPGARAPRRRSRRVTAGSSGRPASQGPYAVFAPDGHVDRRLRRRRPEGAPAGDPGALGVNAAASVTRPGIGSPDGRGGGALGPERVALRVVRRLAPDRGRDLRVRHPEVRGLRGGVEGDHQPHADRDGRPSSRPRSSTSSRTGGRTWRRSPA